MSWDYSKLQRLNILVLGIGKSSLALLDFFVKHKITSTIFDTRDNPPLINQVKQNHLVKIHLGDINKLNLGNYDLFIVSPGIKYDHEILQKIKTINKLILTDIDLFFLLQRRQKVIAITGTNGKSTITALVEFSLNKLGYKAKAAGNIGYAIANVIDTKFDFIVLEISSFQLEFLKFYKFYLSALINIEPDHLDWHNNYHNYIAAKHKIFSNTDSVVINKSDKLTYCLNTTPEYILVDNKYNSEGFGISFKNNKTFLSFKDKILAKTDTLPLIGKHNHFNYLVGFAILKKIGIDEHQIINTMKQFKPLSYRCEQINTTDKVLWVNDSKSTNFAASLAALDSLYKTISGNWVIILGGKDKKTCVKELATIFQEKVICAILIGETRHKLAQIVPKDTKYVLVNSLKSAVSVARKVVKAGDGVLFSPGFSSLDMFANFEQRGLEFNNIVLGLS